MTNFLETFDSMPLFVPTEEAKGPYLPGPVAIEAGVLDDPENQALPPGNPPGIDLANGNLPNAKVAGLVDVGNDIIAFDLVAVDVIGPDHVAVRSISKLCVTSEGKIVGEGFVLAQYIRRGTFRVMSAAIDAQGRPWPVDRLSRGNPNRRRLAGRIAVCNGPAMEVPDFEVDELSVKSGLYTGKRRRRYF